MDVLYSWLTRRIVVHFQLTILNEGVFIRQQFPRKIETIDQFFFSEHNCYVIAQKSTFSRRSIENTVWTQALCTNENNNSKNEELVVFNFVWKIYSAFHAKVQSQR